MNSTVSISVPAAMAAIAISYFNPAYVHSATLIHHYDFSSGVNDLVGSANGVLLGNASVSSGSLNLDGDGDWVQFDSQLVPSSGSFSVALFGLRTSDLSNYTEMISQGSSGPGFYIGTDPTGKIRLGDQWPSTGVNFGAVGILTHYALVADASTGSSKLFVDGQLVASLASAINGSSGGTNTRLGRQFDPYGEYFMGSVDDVRIYSGALTASEVVALANSIPEPATYGLFAIGLAFIWAKARRSVS
jgi:hypothetical protein